MNYRRFTKWHTPTLIACIATLGGCQHVNVAQITYEVLRADDCRRNQLEVFCGRTYASEYYEYVRMREDFLRDQHETKQGNVSDELPL
ncbi:MAG: hypothetical protein AB8B97_02605 [Granulosicoccus sp.]